MPIRDYEIHSRLLDVVDPRNLLKSAEQADGYRPVRSTLDDISRSKVTEICILARRCYVMLLLVSLLHVHRVPLPALKSTTSSIAIDFPWQHYLARNRERANRQIDDWAQLIDAFELQNIKYRYFKGYCALTGLRPDLPWLFTDQDYLIHRDDLEAAEQILYRFGYQRGRLVDGRFEPSKVSIAEDAKSAFGGKHGEPYVRFNAGSVRSIVDLHWRLSTAWEPYSFDIDWERQPLSSQRMAFRGVVFSTLSTLDHFLFLCAHLYRHETELADIRERSDGSLSRIITVALFALENEIVFSDLSKLKRGCLDRQCRVAVEFTLRQIDLLWPSCLPIGTIGMDDSEYSTHARAVRFGLATDDWRIVGEWKSEYSVRLFDRRRWLELRDLEARLRDHGVSALLKHARSPGVRSLFD